MTIEVMRYKLNELRMMLNDGEHTEEQGILADIIKELDKAESDNKGMKKVGDLTLREIKQMCNEKCDKELIYSCMPCSDSEFCPCDYLLKTPFLWDSADLEKKLPRGDKAE